MITIDGTTGEGGGQVLRTALSLSAITGKPFVINNIRGNRSKPGLRQQHLTCVDAAAEICNAVVEGNHIGSSALTFRPDKRIIPGRYCWDIGTAGSTTLVLQTVLPVLTMADRTSHVRITGGTHNPMAPPLDFIQQSFLPLLAGMGFSFELQMVRYGFYPRGGGIIEARIKERTKGRPLSLLRRSRLTRVRAVVLNSGLPAHIVRRERDVLMESRLFVDQTIEIRQPRTGQTGNVVWAVVEYGPLRCVFTGFGQKGKAAEVVAQEVVEQILLHDKTGLPVESHLADQILLYMALRRDGSFATGNLSLHAITNMEIIGKFLPVDFTVEESPIGWLVHIRPMQ
jgi:RNA 3'-terminal phosphate cyclase (ATP)